MQELSSGLEQFAFERLERVGSRLTVSRKLILTILESAKKPMTVTDIGAQAPAMVQSSLYRNLTVLEDAQLVTRIINDNDFAFFELDEHVLGHHHHLRCTHCGDVVDIEMSHSIEELLEKTARSVAKKHAFTHVEHHLDFTGICKKCSRAKTN